ncbi:tudor domain-containing protein 7-like isoform X3 [Artemia franciscana]|uniref:tudor domain-containing protein 7-like isoform X3 n=1 Tax=Artemia franciscana TaxID=6661 RepID=UPI0032DA34F9
MDEESVVKNINVSLVVEEGGIRMGKLDENYQQLFGCRIPYKAFGYSNIRSLLLSHPKSFKIVQCPEGEKVIASADKSTAHIVSLVKGQKKSKPKSARRTAPKAYSAYSRPIWYPNLENKIRRGERFQVAPRFQENFAPRRTEFRLAPGPTPIQHPVPQPKKPQQKPQAPTGSHRPRFAPSIAQQRPKNKENVTSRQKVEQIARQKNLMCTVNTVKAKLGYSAKVDVLKEHTNGMFSGNIEQEYRNMYSEVLPDDWLEVVRPQFAMASLGDRHIVYPEEPGMGASITDLEAEKCPSPVLLQESSDMIATITCVACTTSIYIRIIEVLSNPPVLYQAKFDDFLHELDEFFSNPETAKPVGSVTVGQMYGAYVDEIWQRVLVEKADESGVLCSLVDVGDLEQMNLEDLYYLPKEYTELPFQAIRCQLKGLELFADDDVATQRVQAPDVVGQMALVHIEDRKVDPLIRQMTLEVTMSITAIIDSETKKEFNLNEVTRKSIIDSTKGYDKLQDNVVELAVITGATEDNVIYCHVPDVIKRIEAFMETFKNVKGLPTESNNNISEDECLLVNDEDRWKRARFTANCTNPTHVQVQLIDYGSRVIIPRKNVRSLAKIMPILCDIPKAYECKLSNVSSSLNFPDKVRNWSEGKQIFLKVEKVPKFPSEYYQVDIFKQNRDGNLVSLRTHIEQDWIKRVLPTPALQRAGSSSKSSTPSPTSYLVGNMRQLNLSREDSLHVVALEGVVIPPLPVPDVTHDGFMDVITTVVVSPSKFWIQSYRDQAVIRNFTDEMTEYYTDENLLLFGKNVSVTNATPGKCYAFKHEEVWYRVLLEELKPGASFQGTLIDYGDAIIGHLSGLRTLTPQFFGRPAFAVSSSLADVVPSFGTWTSKECGVFQTLVLNRPLVSEVISTDREGCLVVKLYDTSSEDDVIIAVELKNRLRPLM